MVCFLYKTKQKTMSLFVYELSKKIKILFDSLEETKVVSRTREEGDKKITEKVIVPITEEERQLTLLNIMKNTDQVFFFFFFEKINFFFFFFFFKTIKTSNIHIDISLLWQFNQTLRDAPKVKQFEPTTRKGRRLVDAQGVKSNLIEVCLVTI